MNVKAAICSIRYGNGSIPLSASASHSRNRSRPRSRPVPDVFQTQRSNLPPSPHAQELRFLRGPPCRRRSLQGGAVSFGRAPLIASSIHLPIHSFIHPSIHLILNKRVLEDSTHVFPEVRKNQPYVTDSFQTSASPRNVPHQNIDPHPYIIICKPKIAWVGNVSLDRLGAASAAL